MKKKLLSLLLTVVLVFTSLTFSMPVTKANADTVYYGDVDCDGQVTILDANLIQRHCDDKASLTLDQKKRADVDFNGKITENDAALIKKYLVGSIAKFDKPLYGDANGDGVVSAEDANTIQKYLAHYDVYIDKTAADVDFSGVINIFDATYIQCYLIGEFESFEGYTIKYDANGGSGCMEYQNIGMFDTVNLSPNLFRRTGYAFAGWKIKCNGEYIKDIYGNDRFFTNEREISGLATESKSVLTAYAQWQQMKFSGIFKISPGNDPAKCIGINGASTSDGANAQLMYYGKTANRRFMFCYAGSANCYYIYDTNSNKVLEAANSNVTNGTNIQLNSFTGEKNQIWYLEYASNGFYYICSSINRNYVFDVYYGYTNDGTNLQLFKKHGGSNQQFRLDRVDNPLNLNKAHRIAPRSSYWSCVDVSYAGTYSGTNVWLYTYNYEPQQQYNFSLQPDGSYVIYSCLSDKVLTVEGDKAQNCANIAIEAFNDKASQKWFLQMASNGYYYLASALDTNYVLDVYGIYTSNGTNIQLFQKNGGYNQQFAIQEANYTHIASGTFNLQAFNRRCINIQNDLEILGTNYDIAGTFSNGSNYESKFAFEWQGGHYHVRNNNKYLTRDPEIITDEDGNDIVFSDEKNSIAEWYLECAGNGYYYIHNEYGNANNKFTYENYAVNSFICFKFVRCGTLADYDNLINAINRKTVGLRGAYKNAINTIIRENGSKSSQKCGPWKLVCQ